MHFCCKNVRKIWLCLFFDVFLHYKIENMTNHPLWSDEMWPLVLQLYQRKPAGVKPMYSRDTVSLAIELHIPPQDIYNKMFQLRQCPTASLRRMMDTLGKSPTKLKRACDSLRQMRGCGTGGGFFEGIEINETFERDFKPVGTFTQVTPSMLIMILDLYFRLIPATMVRETPDVQELAHLIGLSTSDVVDILEIYQYCDPFIKHDDSLFDPMLPHCYAIWKRFDNDDPSLLSNTANQLKAYWGRV